MNDSVNTNQSTTSNVKASEKDDLSDVVEAMAEANSAGAVQTELPGLDELNQIDSESAGDQLMSGPDEAKIEPANVSTDKEAARQQYEAAYLQLLAIRAEFSSKPGYIRKKTPEERAFHKVKKIFGGEFNLSDVEAMKENTNHGQGVDVKLPNGETVHLNNQYELFQQIVAFNKELGDFYDLHYLEKNAPEDYQRLQKAQGDLESAKKALIGFFPSKKTGYKEIHSIEKRLQSEHGQLEIKASESANSQSANNQDVTSTASNVVNGNASTSGDTTVDNGANDAQGSKLNELESDIDAAEKEGYLTKKQAELLKQEARKQQHDGQNNDVHQQVVPSSGLAALASYLGGVLGAGVRGFNKNVETSANRFQQFLDDRRLKDKGVSPMQGTSLTESFDEESVKKWRAYNIQQGQERMVTMMEKHDHILNNIVSESEYGLIAQKADEIRKSISDPDSLDEDVLKSKQADLDALHQQAEALFNMQPDLQAKMKDLVNLQDQINHTGMEIAYASRHQSEDGQKIANDVEAKTNEWMEKNEAHIHMLGNLKDKAQSDREDNTMAKRLKESLQKLLDAINSLWGAKSTLKTA